MLSIHRARQQAHTSISGGFSGLQFASEPSKVMGFPVQTDASYPFAAICIPGDSAIDRSAISVAAPVLHVPLVGSRSQVRPLVIERVAVNVVPLDVVTAYEAEQLSVKENLAAVFGSLGVTMGAQMPAPLTRPLGVSSIDQCVGADRAVPGIQRDLCCQPILTEDRNGNGALPYANTALAKVDVMAAARTELSSACLHSRLLTNEGQATHHTGTLYKHRRVPSGGVMPPAALASGAGVSCVNFTTYQE